MVNTKNRGGKTLHKAFTIYTNDSAKPEIRLKVTGKVKGYLTVSPGSVRLFGPVGQPIRSTVRITPLDGHIFAIKEVKAKQDKHLRYAVKPIDNAAGKAGYLLHVENTKKETGNYRDTILIKTDSKHKPLLKIPVFARIQKPSQQRGPKPK